MSLEFYRVLHLIGVFCVLLPLGGIGLHMINGGTRAYPARKLMAMIHGIGLFLVLVAGFGMLAKLGYMHAFPGWAMAKLVIWLLLGGIPALFYRKPQMAKMLFFAVLVLAACAAWLGLIKPF